MDDVTDRLNKIERMLEEIYNRVKNIEKILGVDLDEPLLAITLAQMFEIPVRRAIESALRIRRSLKLLGTFDPLDRAIIEALSVKGQMNVSELTRTVKMIRGKASRTTIRKRLERLEKRGIIEIKREVNRTLVRLRALD